MSTPNFYNLPQSKPIESVRFLSSPSPFSRTIAAATSSSVDILSLDSDPFPNLTLLTSILAPSKITSLKTTTTTTHSIAFSTVSGTIHIASYNPISELDTPIDPVCTGPVHCSAVAGLDVLEGGGGECVSVGMDGRVNTVNVEDEGRVECRRVWDSMGLVGYGAVRWGSNFEFATGGLGFGMDWWDLRKPGGSVSQFKGSWAQGNMSGMVHSIDIHPSRKHICVVGGSFGTIFAWDLRWQKQPIMLSMAGRSPFESEVWEIQYDSHALSSNISSTNIIPVMMCSEDGVLAVVGQGEEPIVLLEEQCAINAFDIDPQNPSDVICALEWEGIGILTRPRPMAYGN